MDRHGSHSQRVPYARKEGRKSLFSKVKDSVKDMLSPSWLSDLVSNVKKETDLEATPTRQPEMNLNPAPGLPQSGVQQHAGAIPFPNQGLPLGNGQPRMMDFPGSRPAMAPGEGLSPFQQPIIPPPVSEFTSSQLPLARLTEKSDSVLANEDSVSQRSDASKSTSGCSSMIPQTDARRRESGLEKRKVSEPEIYSSGSSPPSPQDQPSKRQRLQVSINSSKTWTRGLGDSFSKPQAPAVANKPSFNTSLFGSPLVDDSSLLGTSFHDSSFYPGKTRFGGRSSMSFRSKRNKVDLNQSLPARLSIPVKAFMKAKPKANAAKEAVTSSTAKRILDALDKMPTPLNDAKKIPLAVPRHWTDSPTFFSRDRQPVAPRPGPPTQRLNISSLASISQNRQVATSPPARTPSRSAPQSEVVERALPIPSRDDTIILGGPGAPAAGSGKVRREKSYHRGSAAVTNRPAIQEEDTEILPNLATDFTLPVGSIGAMPKFNFGTPGATQAASSPPSKPAHNFTFSSPIPENVPSNKPRSPETQGGFQFSSPISVDKQEASSGQREPARSVTAGSQPTKSPAPAPFSFGSSLNKSNNMDFTFSSAAAPKPKVTVNGPSTDMGGLKPASDLKQGSVMDILGGGSSAFGGVAPTSQLKQGSVMDILGGSKPSDTSTTAKSSAGTGFTGFQSTQSSAFGSNRSDSGGQQVASATSSSLPPLSSLVNTAGWSCDVCLLQNKAADEKCVACQTAKPGPAKPKSNPAPLSQMFKQSGWTCDACLVQNKSEDNKCVACQSAKPGGSSQASQKLPPLSSMKTGGWTCDVCLVSNKQDSDKCVACQATKPGASVPKAAATSGQNDLLAKFKPAAGQWECEVCLVRNKADVATCAACQTPKPLKSFRHPAGDWTCDTCLVVNKESSVKCVACSYARPGPPRTQTVPSCVKTFTQSANSGFTPSDSSKASNIMLEKGGGFKFVGGDDKGADTGGFKFGAVTSSVKTSEGSQSTGGFKLGDSAVSSSAAGGFQFGSSSDTKPQPAVGGFQFGTGKSTSDKQTSENKLGGNVETSKPLAAGGFSFGAPAAAATQSNSISSESKSVVSTTNALPGGFSFGQSTESKPADPLKATTSVPGGFTFKPSDSVVSSAKTSELSSSQLTSPSVAPSIGGFNFSATSKPQNSLAASMAVTTVQNSAVTQNSVGGFAFTATKVTQSNSETVPSKPSESKPVFGGFSFGSTSTNTSQSTTPAFGGYNFAQKPADSAPKNTTSSQSLKRDRDDDSGATEAKKSLFAFGATTSANTATPFQFGATNNAATSSTASTSSSSGFAFGKQNSTPNFNFSAGKTDSAPAPVFGAANTSSQVGTAGFGGSAAAPTSTTPASTFVFGAQASQQPTTAAAPAFGGFGSTSSFGAATGTAFGGNAPSTTPAFGATPPAFGSTNTSTAAPAFGGKTPVHDSQISSVLSSSLSSAVSSLSSISPHCVSLSTAQPQIPDTSCSMVNKNLVKTGKERASEEKFVSSKENNLLASLSTDRKVRNQSIKDKAGTKKQDVGLVKSHHDLSASLSRDRKVRNQSVEDKAETREQNLELVKFHHDSWEDFFAFDEGSDDSDDITATVTACSQSTSTLVKSHHDLSPSVSIEGNWSVEGIAGTGEQDLGLVKSHHDLSASESTDGNWSIEGIAGTGEQDLELVKSHHDPWKDFFAFDAGSDEIDDITATVTACSQSTSNSSNHKVSTSKSLLSCYSKDGVNAIDKEDCHTGTCHTDKSVSASDTADNYVGSVDAAPETREALCETSKLFPQSKSCQTVGDIAVCTNTQTTEEDNQGPTYREAEVQTVCFQSTQTSDTQLSRTDRRENADRQFCPLADDNHLALIRMPSRLNNQNTTGFEAESIMKHLFGLANFLSNRTPDNTHPSNKSLESASMNNQTLSNATPRVGIGLGPILEENFVSIQTGTSGDRNAVKPCSVTAPCSVVSLSSVPSSVAVPPICMLSSSEASASACCTVDGGPTLEWPLFTLPPSTSTPVTVPLRLGGPADVSLSWSPAGRKVMQSLVTAGLLTSDNGFSAASTTNQTPNVPGTAAFPSTPILGCSSSLAGPPSASLTNSSLPNVDFSTHSLSSVSASQGIVGYTSSASLSSLRCKTTRASLSSCSATETSDHKDHGSFTLGCRSNPCLTSRNRLSAEWPAWPIYNLGIATSPFVSNNCQLTVGTRTLTSSYPVFSSNQSRLSSLLTSNNECFSNAIQSEQYRPATSSLFNWQTPTCVSSARLFSPASANITQPSVYDNQVTRPSMTTAEAEMDMDICNGSNDTSSTRAENYISNNVGQSEAPGHDLHVFSAILGAERTNILPRKAMVGLSGPAAIFDPVSASFPLGFGFAKTASSSYELKSGKSPGVFTFESTNSLCEQKHQRNSGVFTVRGTYSSGKHRNRRNPGVFTLGGASSTSELQNQRNQGLFTFGGTNSSCEQLTQRNPGVFIFGGTNSTCEQQNQRNPGVFTFGGIKSSSEQQSQRNPGVFTFGGTNSLSEQQKKRNPGVLTFGGTNSSSEQQNQRNPGVFTFGGTKSLCEQQSQRNPGVFTFGGTNSSCEQQNQRNPGVFTFGGTNRSCEQQNQRNPGVFTFGGTNSSCEQQNQRNPGVFTFGGTNSSCEQQNQRNPGVFTFGGTNSSCEQQNQRNPGVFTFGGTNRSCEQQNKRNQCVFPFGGTNSSCEQQNQRNPGVFTFGGTNSSCEQQNQRNPSVFTFGGTNSSCEQRNPGVFSFGGTESSCEHLNQRNPGVFTFGCTKSSCEQLNQRNPGVFTFGGTDSSCEQQNQRNPGVFSFGSTKSSCEQQNQKNSCELAFGDTNSSFEQNKEGVFTFGGTRSSFEQQNRIISDVFAFGSTSHSIEQRNQSIPGTNVFDGTGRSFEQQNQKSAGVFTFGSRRSSCEKQNHRSSGLLAFGGRRSSCEQRSQRTSGLFAFGGTSSSGEQQDLKNSGLFAFGGRRSSCEQRNQRTSGLLAFGGTSSSCEQRNQRNPGVYAFGGTSRSCEKPNQKKPGVFVFGGTGSSCDQQNKRNPNVFTFRGISDVSSSFTNSIVNYEMDTPAPNNKDLNHLMTEKGFSFSPQIQFKPILATFSCASTCSTFCSTQSSVSYSMARSEPPSILASSPSAGPFKFSQPIFSSTLQTLGVNYFTGLSSEKFACPKPFLSQSCLPDSDVEMEVCEEVSGASNVDPSSKACMDKFVFSPPVTRSINPNLHLPAAIVNETNEMVSAFMSTRVNSQNLASDNEPSDGACSNQGIFGGIKDFSESMECQIADEALVDKNKDEGKAVTLAKSGEDLLLKLGSEAADIKSPGSQQNSEEGNSSVFQFSAKKQDSPFAWFNRTPDTAAEENKQASFYIDRKPSSSLPDVPLSLKNKTVLKLIGEATEGPDISARVARAPRAPASPITQTAPAAGVFVFSARSQRSTCSFNPKPSCCGATSDILRSIKSSCKPSAFSGIGKSSMSERVLEYFGPSGSDSSLSSDSSSSSSSCSPSTSDSSSARSSASDNSLSSYSDTACSRREQPEPNYQDEESDEKDEEEEKNGKDDDNSSACDSLRVDYNKRFGFLAGRKHAKRRGNKSWNAVPAHIARNEEKLRRISSKIQQTNQPISLPTGSCINQYWNVVPDVVHWKSFQRLGMSYSSKLEKLSTLKADGYSCHLSMPTALLLGTDGHDPKCYGHHPKYFVDDVVIDNFVLADWRFCNNELRFHGLENLIDSLQMLFRSAADADVTTTGAAITDFKLCACAICLLYYFSIYLSGSGFNFKTETNNNSTPTAPAQSNAIFQFGAKPAEASQPSAGFNFNPNPAGLGSQSSFNFGAGSAPGSLSFSAQPTATPAGQPERRIKKAVRKIRR